MAMTKEDRLEQVWAALINPKRTIRSIQILAQEHGFDDLAEFNEDLRKRYGLSAREIRKAAKIRGSETVRDRSSLARRRMDSARFARRHSMRKG